MNCNECYKLDVDNTECKYGTSNYRCKALLVLRKDPFDGNDDVIVNGEQRSLTIPTVDECFIILGWYKDRGRTEIALFLDETEVRPLTSEDLTSHILECGL